MPTRFTIKSNAGGSSTQEFSGAPEQIYFEDLQPETSYTVTAELYDGDTVIDTDTKTFKTSIDYITDVFYLQNEVESENVLTLAKTGTPKTTDLQYSLDEGSNWTAFDLAQETNTVTIPAAGRVYMRSSTGFSLDFLNRLSINCSQNFSIHGNLQCLHNYKDLNNLSVYANEFYGLFGGANTLISAKYMYLPATTLADSCYSGMFRVCTSLTTAPELPATTLATYCYEEMFYGCKALTVAPELPAKTLASSCYKRMFYSCTSLTSAPTVLPSTTLAGACYNSMFQYCTSLTTAPELPATTFENSYGNQCYGDMFKNCTALQSVTTYCVDWNTSYTGGWLSNAGTNAENPTVYCPADSTIPSDSTSGIPEGWTRADLVTN